MDRIRRAFSNADGTPRTGLTVEAQPVLGGSPVSMPETTAGKSGIYASSGEVEHGTYSIWVNGSDTGDTQVVEPGLHLYDYPNAASTAAIDRSLSDSVRLSNFLLAGNSTPTHANMASACALAALRGKKLILDMDVTTTSAISVTGNLTIDLNGHTLTLGAPITASLRMVAMFGKAVCGSGKYLRGVSSQLFLGVDFTGFGDEQVAESDSGHTVYIACPGISRTDFSGSAGSWTGPIVIGCDAAGTADRLMLGGSPDVNTGNTRLTNLQTFVDSHVASVMTNNSEYNFYRNAFLQLVDEMPTATRDKLAEGKVYAAYLDYFQTAPSQDCDLISVVGGQFTRKNSNAHDYVAIANGGTYTPNGRVSYLAVSSTLTLNKPSDLTKVCSITLLSDDAESVAVTAHFNSGAAVVRYFDTFEIESQDPRYIAITLTWNPVAGFWYCTHKRGIG